jgi:hypothetical protein
MKDAMRSGEPAVEVRQESLRRAKKRLSQRCSICASRTWFDPIFLVEPVGAPEPRHSWVLCRDCYGALLSEMRRSPVRSPLRLRIAIGIVASERWDQAHPGSRTSDSDRRLILFIAWGFVIFMLIHLMIIVMLAYIAR